MHTVKTVLRLPLSDQILLVEALTLLALSRTAVLLLPFRWVARVLGKQEAPPQVHEDPESAQRIRHVGAMVRRAAKNVPWTSKCLDQALAAKVMLARRGIPATVYFGVKNDEHGDLSAHAWLRSGSLFVTGGRNHARFTVINAFTDRRSR